MACGVAEQLRHMLPPSSNRTASDIQHHAKAWCDILVKELPSPQEIKDEADRAIEPSVMKVSVCSTFVWLYLQRVICLEQIKNLYVFYLYI